MTQTDSPEALPDQPLVSVVIATYNGERHIAQTLQSVLGQSHPVLDIIVVDDGSSDGTVEAVRALQAELRVIQRKNGGVSSARNAGASVARGDLICFLDQDDVWHPEHLSGHLRTFAACPAAGAVFSPLVPWHPSAGVYESPAVLWPTSLNDDTEPEFSGWIYHQFLLDCWALTSATTLRRSALVEYGAFDEALPYSEDWELWLRLSRKIQFVQRTGPPVLYRQHPAQGSRKFRDKDYRCDLLLKTARVHGLASPDGRCVDPALFHRTIARYQTDFGYGQLQHGAVMQAVRTLLRAWVRNPAAVRPLALAAAGCLGWRPR